MPSDIAVYGLGVMGRNIALNMADHGLKVAVYNRTASVTDDFVARLPPTRPSWHVTILPV